MIDVRDLWTGNKESGWLAALDYYWKLVKPENLELEREMDSLDASQIEMMSAGEWYSFLLNKYFVWKYTAPNRLATTTGQFRKYRDYSNGLVDLSKIKKRLFSFDKNDIAEGLKIACSIRGLGTAGGSGLLALLFPRHFGTVDQFVVKALAQVDDLPERERVRAMKPEQLGLKNGVLLIQIMRDKAQELNREFKTNEWTPRKVDMALWVANR